MAKIFDTISSHPLQTREWGKFREKWGNEILWTKYGLLTFHKIPFTSYKIGMFIKGPKPTQEMLTKLKALGLTHNLIFIKLEPNFAKASLGAAQFEKIKDLLKKNGCVPGKTLFTPTTFWIDLTKSEDELLKSFHPKTRYNIRLAQKHGIKIEIDPPSLKLRGASKAFEKYIELMQETVKRQGFYAHTEKYHRLLWKFLYTVPVTRNSQPIAHLLTAKYNGKIITAWILFVWKDFLYYPYGASSDKYKNLMANNLMMWEAIKFGKRLGLKTFDLWGREPGKGFTKFKEGYNPQVVEFLGTWELIINKPLYDLYRFFENLRWRILRLKSNFIKPSF